MARSAIAVLETSDAFVLEGPDPSRERQYDGIRLFGGGIRIGESPVRAIRRELREELGIIIPREQGPTPIGEWYDFETQNRSGVLVVRDFHVFHALVGSATELNLQVEGSIVEIPKASIADYQDRLTRVALEGLNRLLDSRYTNIGNMA